MSTDFKVLFANNFFTRAQVDVLVRLAEMVMANAGGGGVADPNKVDKTTQIATINGLQGGGDLSQSRTLSIDLTYLDEYYPRMVNGKISSSVLPAITVSDTFAVASEAAMLALAANKGDIAIRSDISKTFILAEEPASTLANWKEMLGGSGVTSFNGRVGAVAPQNGDYTFSMISGLPTTLAGYGITNAEPAITPHADGAARYWGGDKVFYVLDKAAVGLANVDNTSDNAKPLGTTQLARLAQGDALTLIGTAPSGSGAITRAADAVVYELGVSLRMFAQADGTDETTRVQSWLDAVVSSGRRGYVPAGDYRISAITAVTDNLNIECHPNARFIAVTGSTAPAIKITSSTGTSTARAGRVRWRGGKFLLGDRETAAAGLALENFLQVAVEGVRFIGKDDYEAGITAARGGYGLTLTCCDNVTVAGSTFIGLVEAGVQVRGGTLPSSVSDDGVGAVITANHFVKCQYGVRAERAVRNVQVATNSFDRCFVGVAGLDADSVTAGYVSAIGNVFRRPGRNAVYLRLARGAVIGENVITDPGYKLDGITASSGTVAGIHLLGCDDVSVSGNVVRMEELTKQAGAHGIRLEKYTFGADVFCEGCHVSGNSIRSLGVGISEDGTSVDVTYRNNRFFDVTTEYSGLPSAFAPYGSYTPIPTAITNVAGASGQSSQWRRIEHDVIVNFAISVDPTASGAAEVEITLPVDPGVNFGSAVDVIGCGYSDGADAGARVLAKAGARVARVLMNFPTNTAAQDVFGTFSYRIGAVAVATPPPAGANSLTDENGNAITTETGQEITV